ncbi:MAG: hypothetical protein AAF518_03290 [Spirochaetota bacterium]
MKVVVAIFTVLLFCLSDLQAKEHPPLIGCSENKMYYLQQANAEDFNEHDVIILAKATNISKQKKSCLTKFRVLQDYKGASKKEISLKGCRYNSYNSFLPGKTYLIYAKRNSKGIVAPYCNKTKEMLSRKKKAKARIYHGITLRKYLESKQKQSDFELQALASLRKQKSGSVQSYYRNGVATAKGNFQNGKPHGKWEYYFPDGILKARGRYEKGKKVGVWLETRFERLHPNSPIVMLVHKGVYKKGIRQKAWSTYLAGTKLYEVDYKNKPKDNSLTWNQKEFNRP